jgi:hypothetical protein
VSEEHGELWKGEKKDREKDKKMRRRNRGGFPHVQMKYCIFCMPSLCRVEDIVY